MDLTIELDDDGALLIGHAPAAPAGAGHVLLPGAEAFLDPTAPDDPPYVVVHDLAEAAPAVLRLLGADVADAATRVADGAPRTAAPATPWPSAPGPGAAVRELALLGWLHRMSPDRLPLGLLDLSWGTAASTAADLVDQAVADEAARRLLRRSGLVLDLARRLRDGTAPGMAPALVALVVAALPITCRVVPFDHPDHADLVHEHELFRALRSFGDGRTPDWDRLGAGLADRSVGAARSAGEHPVDPQEPLAGVSSVDWTQVPRDVLDTAENTVEWQVTPGATVQVQVQVRGQSDGRVDAALAFRLYGPSLPFPLATGRLRINTDGTYGGTAAVHGPLTGPLVVDVHDEHDFHRPALGPDRVGAEAARWAARSVTALRLGAPATDPAPRAAAQQAARLYQRVEGAGGAGPNGPDAASTRRRRARCIALVRMLLRNDGQRHEAEDLDDDWGAPVGPLRAADVALPDPSGPGWAPLAVEAALADPWFRGRPGSGEGAR